jgi:non-heme chloroperoxidase
LLGGFTIDTREVTRCLAQYGSGRVAKAVMFGVIPPFLLKTENNPEGVDRQEFENIKASIVNDRYASFEDFLNNFCNTDRAWQASFIVASGTSPYATYGRVDTCLTDFRANLAKVDVPTLVVHGTEDRILPHQATAAARLRGLIRDVKSTIAEAAHTISAGPRRGQHRPARVPHQPARRNLPAVGGSPDICLQR